MTGELSEFAHYPDDAAVDAWLEAIWRQAQEVPLQAELLDDEGYGPQLGVRHPKNCRYVRFSPEGMEPYYGYWQPAPSQPAPLLVHTPGYGAEMSAHPELVVQGYNVLHVNPLGYVTPQGENASKKRDGSWPVLRETASSRAQHGYRLWLTHCALAVRWAQQRQDVLPGRLSFFGTSQGGGASLLLGSLYRGRGVRCVAADVPWMINFPLAKASDVEWGRTLFAALSATGDPADGWYALGMIDALSHARRLDLPVLLVAGGEDATCLPATIESLLAELPGTKAYCYLKGQGHAYTQEFVALACAWFRLYA